LPVTVAVPTVVPPVLQLVGALACGPKMVNVTVPPAELVTPDRTAEIELAAIVLPVDALSGPLAVTFGEPETSVEAIELPHALLAALSPASPP
jgi:hypothetical protein